MNEEDEELLESLMRNKPKDANDYDLGAEVEELMGEDEDEYDELFIGWNEDDEEMYHESDMM